MNSAAIYPRKPLLEISDADWDLENAVNVKGTYHIMVAAVLHMRKFVRPPAVTGRIVNVTSVDAFKAHPQNAHYAATKAAVVSLTKSFAQECAKDQILVNSVAPAGFVSDRAKQLGFLPELAKSSALGRAAEPEEMAEWIAMMASSRNTYATGENVVISGGYIYVWYKTAVVTGATSGIGRATVLGLLQLEMSVFAVGRNKRALAELANESGAVPIHADVRDTQTIADQISELKVDVLVNNAGVLPSRVSFQDIDPHDITEIIDINLKAPIHLTRVVLPGMVKRKRGHLIYVGSSAGQAPHPLMSVYGSSKAGISLFCDNLRCDLLGTSVRVSEIVPGRVQTDLYKSALGAKRATLYDGYRPVQPQHVASLIATVIDLPSFVDVSRIEVFPTDQATGGGSMVKFK